jgi:hypothetical protein
MGYHIDTGLIYEKFSTPCDCPLCEIKKIVEEQFLHEFLNDAVMEDNTRIKVGKKGFCARHFDMLLARPNKLSLALQIRTRIEKALPQYTATQGNPNKLADKIIASTKSCAICDFVEESMVKYYKTIAQMFAREKEFFKTLLSSNGFCMHHYAELLRYSSYAGFGAKSYLELLSDTQVRNTQRLQGELKEFCDKHDYRNALKPLGNAQTALPRTRIKVYGAKSE